MPKKLIFLDIDGVLNSDEFFGTREKVGDELSRVKVGISMIDKHHLGLLNNIIEATNAYLVISSTWRFNYYEALPEILNNLGFYNGQAKERILDKTPKSSCEMCNRGNEINHWLKSNAQYLDGIPYYRYKNYCIIDDDSDMLLCQKDNFIQTSWQKGLENHHVERIIKILNQGDKDDIFKQC